MNDLSLHDTTRKLVESYVARPTHGLLLSGQMGMGLHALAQIIARRLAAKVTLHEILPDDKGTIAIETVRSIYRLGRTQREAPLVVIIDDADAMGREAQNALLKLLEEPSRNLFFILTSHAPQLLLPTIMSRVQRIDALPLSAKDSEALIDPTAANRAQLLFLATGLPAELTRLQQDEAYFKHRSQLMKDARGFLESDTYGKIALSAIYGTSRATAEDFLQSLLRLMSYMVLSKHDVSLVTPMERIHDIIGHLRQNGHAKTQLLSAVTAFSTSDTIVN